MLPGELVKVGTQELVLQQSVEQLHSSWMDINLGSASIGIECGHHQIVIPAATVARATILSHVDFFEVRLDLSVPLNIDGEDASFVKLKFRLDSGIPALLHNLLGHKVEMDQRSRGSRSEAIKVPGSTVADEVVCDKMQLHQETTREARVPARRKSSTSGVVDCRKMPLPEPSLVPGQPCTVDTEELRDDAVQEELLLGQRKGTSSRESGARASRAKAMDERRRELERNISDVAKPNDSRRRSTPKPSGATGRRGQGVEEKKRRKSSRSIGEVVCRKQRAMQSPLNDVSNVADKGGVEPISADGAARNQGKLAQSPWYGIPF